MTQAEVIWVLLSVIQLAVIGFIKHWTRRVQDVERLMAENTEKRTQQLLEYQGRLTKIEATSEARFIAIMDTLRRIEKRVDGHEEE